MKAYYWAILATLVWGVAPLVEKIGLVEISPVPGVFLRSISVLIGAVVIAIIDPGIFKVIAGYSMKSVIFIFTGGMLASIIGSIFFYNALKLGEASKVVPIAACFPLVSFVLAIIFLHEAITVVKVIGMLFVIAGIYLLR